jgi:MarR-like DNA-binding transcriptional regulator SgrR of sgrS sRNA
VAKPRAERSRWKFLTNHAHVLVCLSRRPTARTRDLAEWIGITDRAAQRIVSELQRAGYLTHVKVGRGKKYRVLLNRPLRHPLQSGYTVRTLLDLEPRIPSRRRA